MVWLLAVKKSLMICLSVSTQYWRATDIQDRRTDILRQHIVENGITARMPSVGHGARFAVTQGVQEWVLWKAHV